MAHRGAKDEYGSIAGVLRKLPKSRTTAGGTEKSWPHDHGLISEFIRQLLE